MRHRWIVPAALALCLLATPAVAATFTVTSADDSGAGSLRQAILDANAAAGHDVIVFAVGSGARTISLASDLPRITSPVLIDGRTQPGYAGKPLITVTPVTQRWGLMFMPGAEGSEIQALVLNGFTTAVWLEANGCRVFNSWIGVGSDGLSAHANAIGIAVWETVGGATIADNVIAGNAHSDLEIGYVAGGQIPLAVSRVERNLIGFAVDGVTLLSPYRGAVLNGNTEFLRNVVATRSAYDLRASGINVVIKGNSFGADIHGRPVTRTSDFYDCVTLYTHQGTFGGADPADGNRIVGCRVAMNVPGRSNLIQGNTIHHNLGVGVRVSGTGNAIWANSIHDNLRGIALGDGPPIANDPQDADSGPNLLQNHPTISRAVSYGTATEVTGALHSAPSSSFRIEFFANPTCDASTRRFLAAIQVSTNNAGDAPFTVQVPDAGVGSYLTATATDPQKNTSEISPCRLVTGPPLLVPVNQRYSEFAGSVPVTINRTGDTTGTASVYFSTADGTATAGEDYEATTGTVTFAPGQTSKTIDIRLYPDNRTEPDETFVINFSNVIGAGISRTSATVTLVDDDPPFHYAFEGMVPPHVVEGGSVTVAVLRVGDLSTASRLLYKTIDGTARAGDDYPATAGFADFAPGVGRMTVTIPTNADAIYELAERFLIRFDKTPEEQYQLSGPAVQYEVTIMDDEPRPVVDVLDASIAEGNDPEGSLVTVTLRLSGCVAQPFAVTWETASASASAGSDYVSTRQTVTFPADQLTRDVHVRIVGDTNDEGDETFVVRIVRIEPCCNAPAIGRAGVMTIANDDVGLSVSDVDAAEGTGDVRTIDFTVTLSGRVGFGVKVDYMAINGSATPEADYTPRHGTLMFQPGETTKVVSLPIVPDSEPEPNETLYLRILDPIGVPITHAQAKGTIVDDDEPMTVTRELQFAQAGGVALHLDLYVPNGGGNGTFPLIVWIPDRWWWSGGSRLPLAALREIPRGYAVAAVDYRSSSDAEFPAQLHDLKAAVRWLRANASRFRIDSTRIAAWGFGASGHLAALLGTTGDVASLEDLSLGNPTESSRVQAVIDWSGPIDLLELEEDALPCATIDHRSAGSFVSLLLGCPPQLCQEKANAASPATYITSDDPPFLILHATDDCDVSPAQSESFARALRAAGVDATLRLLTRGGHVPPGVDAEGLGDVDAFLDSKIQPSTRRRSVR